MKILLAMFWFWVVVVIIISIHMVAGLWKVRLIYMKIVGNRGSMWGCKWFNKRTILETSYYLKDDCFQDWLLWWGFQAHAEGRKICTIYMLASDIVLTIWITILKRKRNWLRSIWCSQVGAWNQPTCNWGAQVLGQMKDQTKEFTNFSFKMENPGFEDLC